MKKIFFLSVFLMLASCNKGISQETISEVKKNENFWKQREKMITDNEKDNEFPIKKDRLVNEKRVNSIDIHSQSLQFEVYVDDVLLYNFKGEASQHQGGAIGAHEINPLLLTSGTHEVKVRMYPALGQNIFGDAGGLNLIFFHYPYPNLKQVTYNAAIVQKHIIDIGIVFPIQVHSIHMQYFCGRKSQPVISDQRNIIGMNGIFYGDSR